MRRFLALASVAVFFAACYGDAHAQRRGGGRAGGGARAGGAPRPATRPSGGFNFGGDIGSRPGGGARPPGAHPPPPGARPPGAYPPGARPPGAYPPGARPPRPPGPPPYPVPPNYGWNRGIVWAPAPYYWGGGFWGAYGLGVTTAVVFGTITNEETKEQETSYQVAPDSPGAKVLAAYSLTQVPCGPDNLVVIHGPNASIVCATPNQIVAAGHYNLDVANLTLTTT